MSQNKSVPLQPVLCVASNQASCFCINKSCSYTPVFVCESTSCQCHQLHEKCKKSDINLALTVLKSETNSKITQLKDNLIKQFDDIIFQLIEVKSKMLEKIKNFEDLNIIQEDDQELQKLFMDVVNNHQKSQLLTGKITNQVWRQISKKYEVQKAFLYDFTSEQYGFELIQQQLSKTLNKKIQFVFDIFQKFGRSVKTKKVTIKTKKIVKDSQQNKQERIKQGWKKWLSFEKRKRQRADNKLKSLLVPEGIQTVSKKGYY